MDLDEKAKIYNDGFKKGQEHNQPSVQTLKFMENTDKRLEKVEIKLGDLCENHLPHLREDIALIQSGINEIKTAISDMPEKYAPKQIFDIVKNIVFGMVAFILVSVLSAVIYLIIK